MENDQADGLFAPVFLSFYTYGSLVGGAFFCGFAFFCLPLPARLHMLPTLTLTFPCLPTTLPCLLRPTCLPLHFVSLHFACLPCLPSSFTLCVFFLPCCPCPDFCRDLPHYLPSTTASALPRLYAFVALPFPLPSPHVACLPYHPSYLLFCAFCLALFTFM